MPTIQVPPGQPSTPAVVFLVLPALAARAQQDLDREHAHRPVREAAPEGGEAVEARVRALGAVAERGADEPPERVAAEADRDEREEQLAERLMRDRVQRALLVRQLAAVTECDLEREDADDRVDRGRGRRSRLARATRRPSTGRSLPVARRVRAVAEAAIGL